VQSSRFYVFTCTLLCCISIAADAYAQENDPDTDVASIRIGTVAVAPQIDGKIEESEWAGAVVVDQQFRQFQPDFGDPSPFLTVVRIAQTKDSIYIAFESLDPEMEQLATAKTQRDGNLGQDDSVGVMLDSFGDQRTAYGFQVNALGTQKDFRIADNGRTSEAPRNKVRNLTRTTPFLPSSPGCFSQ